MTPQELKASILQLAIQGKLVEQHPEEGTGEELLLQIQTEKQRFIKAGIIKKEKPLPEIAEDEIPFDIPDSWKWVKLGDVADINGGFAFKSTNYTTDGVRVVRISDFNESGFVNDKIVRHPYEESLLPFVLEVKNILLCMTGGTVGKSFFVTELNEKMVVNQRVATIKVRTVLPEYVNQVILAPITQKVIQDSKNSTNDNISMDTIKGFLIPLPPISEQKRIVAKIEELLPLIDRYEQAWSKLEDFNKRFPVDMQKSILQMAIQGKLVPQLPEEGTGEELFRQIQAEKQRLIKAGTIKKEKPLPEIAEDEIPFDIPESWKWVYIGDLFQHNTGKALNSSNKSGSPMEYITTSNVYWNSFTLDKLKTMLFTKAEVDKCTVQKGDLLVLEGGDVGRAAIWNYDFPMRIQNHIHKLRPFGDLCIEYFYHIFFLYKNAGMINGKGIGIKGLSSGALHNLIIPLPPLAEQKRIVAKLEEILPLCERLK